jgi:hypothetical protein
VFDDRDVGLVREPFVSGADDVIESFAQRIPGSESGFNMVFSAVPFPGHDAEFVWLRAEAGGNRYHLAEPEMDGWLCPAVLKYFAEPPARLYVRFG